MPIKVHCGSCSAIFQAKDELMGRRVKCPKCKDPLTIGASQPATAKAGATKSGYNPLLDLLEEENVRPVARGPVCENCGKELEAGAVICIECGFNQETGDRLETEAYEDDADAGAESTMSDAERIMAKAEKEIEDVPVTADQQNFGDGAESYMIAFICGVIGIILIGIGMVIIFSMDTIGQYVASSAISFIASIGLYICCGIWISIVAFSAKWGHGLACILTGFTYCIVFGFMQGKSLLMPTIILIVCLVVGLASGVYTMYNGWVPQDAMLIQETARMFGLG